MERNETIANLEEAIRALREQADKLQAIVNDMRRPQPSPQAGGGGGPG